ncbi:hypothetical protein ACVIDN_006181 [Rhizobium brockwellii]
MDRVQQVPKWKGKLFVDADSAPVCKAARAICTYADGSHAGYDVKGARRPDSTPAQPEESPLGEKPLAAKRWDWATTDTGGAAASFPNYSEEMHWGSRHASSPPRAAGLTLPWTFPLKPAVGMPPRAILQKRAPIVLGPVQRVSPPLSKRHKLDGGFLLRNLSASKCLLCARNGLENQTSPPGSRWSVQIGSCQLFIWPASIPRSVGIHPMSLIT